MEELKRLSKEESWTAISLPDTYHFRQIEEISNFIKSCRKSRDQKPWKEILDFELDNGNPFGISFKVGKEETTDEEDYDIEEGEGKEEENDIARNGYIISATTNHLVKIIGKYLCLMKALSQISWDIFDALTQLLSCYVWNIYSSFGPLVSLPGLLISKNLSLGLKFMPIKLKTEDGKPLTSTSDVDVGPNTVFGVFQRACASESLIFVRYICKEVKDYIKPFLPEAKHRDFDKFYRTVILTLEELKKVTYKGFCSKIVNPEDIIKEIVKVAWNRDEVPMSHNNYVVMLLDLMRSFKEKYDRLKQVNKPSSTIDKAIWSAMVSHIFDCLIEGFATDKCSIQGRALMQLDVVNLTNGLEKFFKPINIFHIDSYIKAYYTSDDDIIDWISKTKTEYTKKQLENLIHAGLWDMKAKRKCLEILR